MAKESENDLSELFQRMALENLNVTSISPELEKRLKENPEKTKKMIEALLESGADPDQKNNSETPLSNALQQGANFQFPTYDPRFGEPQDLEPADWWDMHHNGAAEDHIVAASDQQTFNQFIDELPAPDLKVEDPVAALMTKQGEYAPIDNPRVWDNMPAFVAHHNAAGRFLQFAELLGEDGAPTPLFARAIEYGQVDPFFVSSNWKGASKAELNEVLSHVPSEMRAEIPTLHQLSAAVSRSDGKTRER